MALCVPHSKSLKMVDRKNPKVTGFSEESTVPFVRTAPATIAATDAKNRFGELLEMARKEPVHIQKNGRTVAVMVSPEEYQRLLEGSTATKVRPLVEELLERSIQRRRSLYQALAK
jgi:prevent-host-death family protein